MSDKLHDTCYMWFPRKSEMVRQRTPDWRCGDGFIAWSAESAWYELLRMHAAGHLERPDPADYIIVAGLATENVDYFGARLIRADWEHTYDPQGFYEEVERERRLAEEKLPELTICKPGDIEVGDNVRIISRGSIADDEWDPGMESLIGMMGVVISIDEPARDSIPVLVRTRGNRFFWAFDSLQRL